MRKYHQKEKKLLRKVEELEQRVNQHDEMTSKFGTGKLLSHIDHE